MIFHSISCKIFYVSMRRFKKNIDARVPWGERRRRDVYD
jgi:hypothetical protein